MNELTTNSTDNRESSFRKIDSEFKLIDKNLLIENGLKRYHYDTLIYDVCCGTHLAADDESREDHLFRALFSDDIEKVKECTKNHPNCIFPVTNLPGRRFCSSNNNRYVYDSSNITFPLRLVKDEETFLHLFDHAIKYEMENVPPRKWSIGGLLSYRKKEETLFGDSNYKDLMMNKKLIYPNYESEYDDVDNLPWCWYDWNFDMTDVEDENHVFWKMVHILKQKYPTYPIIELMIDGVFENYEYYDYEDESNNDKFYSRFTVYFFEAMLHLYGENLGVMNPDTGRLPVFTALAYNQCSLMRLLGTFMEPLFVGDIGPVDPVTGLYPFMLAASSIEVEEKYESSVTVESGEEIDNTTVVKNDDDDDDDDDDENLSLNYPLTDVYILLREHPMDLIDTLSRYDDGDNKNVDVNGGVKGKGMKRELVGSDNEEIACKRMKSE